MLSAHSVLVDGRAIARIGGSPVSVTACADGLHAFVLTRAEEGVAELWRVRHDDGAVERLIAEIALHPQGRGGAVVASATPRVFVFGEFGGTIRWYDADGRAGAVVPHGRRVLECASAPDGARLAVVCEPDYDATRGDRFAPTGRVLDVESGATCLAWICGAAGAFSFTDDGAALAYVDAAKTSLVIASLADGATRSVPLRAPVEPRRVLAERGGARLAVVAAPCELIVCEPGQDNVVARLWADDKAVVIGFAAGKIVTQERVGGGTRGVVRDVDSGDEAVLGGDGHAVGALTPDGGWMVRHAAPIVERIDLRDGRSLRLHDGHETLVRDVAWSADGAWLATVAMSGAVRVWDVGGRELVWEFEASPRAVHTVVFSPDRLHLYGVGSSFVAWGLADGAERQRVPLADSDFTPVAMCRAAVSPDGQRVLTNATGGVVFIERPADAPTLRRLRYLPGAVRHLSFDGVARFRVVQVREEWSPRRTFVQAQWRDLSDGLLAEAEWAMDGAMLWMVEGHPTAAVMLDRGDLVRLDLSDASWRGVLVADAGYTRVVAAAAARVVVERGDGRYAAIDLRDGRVEAVWSLARREYRTVVSPDGARVAVVYWDGGVEVFELTEGSGETRPP
jgi:hypothetical protein